MTQHLYKPSLLGLQKGFVLESDVKTLTQLLGNQTDDKMSKDVFSMFLTSPAEASGPIFVYPHV